MLEILNHASYAGGDVAPEGPSRSVLVLGQDQITAKAVYYARELERFGVATHFFSLDKSGFSQANAERFGVGLTLVPRGFFAHWMTYLRLLRRTRPAHIEIFPGARPWHLLFYVAVARLARIPMLTWCRGNELLYWTRHHPIRRVVNAITFRASRVMLLRELYMERIVEDHGLAPKDKLLLCHNSVPLPEDPGDAARQPLVLFLNSFKKWRNVELVVRAAAQVLAVVPGARFELVGATSSFESYSPTSDSVEASVRAEIERLGVGHAVSVLPFTNDATEYFRRASVFVLPADIVFCNFALLEAMAMRVVPIVADVEGADLIVEDGVSGFVAPRDARALAARIIELLDDPARRARMGAAARARVADRYDSRQTAVNLYALYRRRMWTRAT